MVEITQLSDELLGDLILNRVLSEAGNADRRRVSQVCKQWLKLEGLTRRSLTLLKVKFLCQVLPRFPNLITFRTSQPFSEEADFIFLAQTCPKLEVINLYTTGSWSLQLTGLSGLSLGGGLPKLSKLSIGGRRNVGIERWLHTLAHDNLTYLDLGRCRLVDDDAAQAIGLLCTCLSYLNLEESQITGNGLRSLANGRCSKTLKTLVLARCSITDSGISHLKNMHCLEDLDLDRCLHKRTWIFASTGIRAAIYANQSIKKLNLSWMKNVCDRTVIFIAANCPNLKTIDLSGSSVTSTGLRAFSRHRCLESLVLRIHPRRWLWSDVEAMVLGCYSIKSIFLSKKIKKSIPESVSGIVTLVDEW